MKSKDTQLLEEAYNQVSLTEGLMNTLLVKPLQWVIAKILSMTLSQEKRFKLFKFAVTTSVEQFREYMTNSQEKDSGTLSPDQYRKVEQWEAKYPTPEDFMKETRSGFEQVKDNTNKSTKMTDYEKKWILKQMEELEQEVESDFEFITSGHKTRREKYLK
jgi:hypothetical protein